MHPERQSAALATTDLTLLLLGSTACESTAMRDFPKIKVPYFGVPIIRILLFRVITILESPYFRKPPCSIRVGITRGRSHEHAASESSEPFNKPDPTTLSLAATIGCHVEKVR